MSFELVRALYDKKLQLPEETNFYKQALKDILQHGISPQIYYLLKKQEKLEQTPMFFRERLKEKYNEALFQNVFIKNQTEKVLNLFEEMGIAVIPLKGTRFAEKYFGHLASRPTSDIDLLIRSDDIGKAIAAIRGLGFLIDAEIIPDHFHVSFSKELPGSKIPLTIELHWDLLKEKTANMNIDDFWNEALPVGESHHIKELSNYHAFYMICLHGWRHNLDSLKYFIDIIQMIDQMGVELDYERLFRESSSHKTCKRLVRTLSIVYHEFPHLNSIIELPLKRKMKNREGILNNPFKKYADFIDYQFLSYDSARHSFIEIFKWLRPSKTEVNTHLVSHKTGSLNVLMYLYIYLQRVSFMLKAIFPFLSLKLLRKREID